MYDIIDEPALTPVTIPVTASIDATAGVVLLQVPPIERLPRVDVLPIQMPDVPVIVDGSALTVTTTVCLQVLGIV